jgi:hypothetical protein
VCQTTLRTRRHEIEGRVTEARHVRDLLARAGSIGRSVTSRVGHALAAVGASLAVTR